MYKNTYTKSEKSYMKMRKEIQLFEKQIAKSLELRRICFNFSSTPSKWIRVVFIFSRHSIHPFFDIVTSIVLAASAFSASLCLF